MSDIFDEDTNVASLPPLTAAIISTLPIASGSSGSVRALYRHNPTQAAIVEAIYNLETRVIALEP